MKPKPPVPMWRWGVWYTALGAALVLFYGLFTPFWFGLRALAWVGGVPGATPPRSRIDSAADGRARYVYDFDEPVAGGRELLGGKGIGLAEMTLMGVPVPAGFTITTDACRAVHGAQRRRCRTGSRTRSTSTCGGSRSGRASGSARATTRCSSRCARARPSRCRG